MSDFTDVLIDGPQPVKRIPYWKSKFAEQQELVRKKNRELVELRAENERLLGILQFSRWTHDTHRPSYALNCLYEGEITIAKFCEWMKAFVAGVDEPLPDVKYRSCGSEFTPKELEAENARLRAALEPFARWANQMDSPPNWVPDGCPIIASPGDISDFFVGMLRRARAALAGKEQG